MLGDLFEIIGTKSLDRNAIEFVQKGINFVGRSFENNGIQGKIERRDFAPNPPFTITATVIGNYKYVKYQTEPYYCSQNINRLTPKDIITKWNNNIAYFFVANVQKFVSMYDYQQGGYKLVDIKQHKISLPIRNNEIDFDFMDSFIAELEAERIAELEAERIAELSAYLSVSGLDNYELSDEELKVLQDYDTVEWKEYSVTKLFKVKNTKNILARDIKPNSGTTPYLCASRENNAISSYIKHDTSLLDEGNCIFIGGKTFVVTYQENDFYSNDSHNLALYLLENKYRTENIQLFLSTCLIKGLSHKYSWGNSISNKKIQSDKIILPIKNNEINFEFLDKYINAVKKLSIKNVVQYSNQKIEATKTVVLNHQN